MDDDEISAEHQTPTTIAAADSSLSSGPSLLVREVWSSSALLFKSKLSWLLVLGPIALMGDATGILGEATCFAFSGIALIPCAERYVG